MKRTCTIYFLLFVFTILSVTMVIAADPRMLEKPGAAIRGQQPTTIPLAPGRITGQCQPLQFVSTSPLPTAVVGGDYSFQFEVSGGAPPYTFCSLGPNVKHIPFSTSNGCFPLAAGNIPVSASGLMKGQIHCDGPYFYEIFAAGGGGLRKCDGYWSFGVKVTDSCPFGAQSIVKEYFIEIKAQP